MRLLILLFITTSLINCCLRQSSDSRLNLTMIFSENYSEKSRLHVKKVGKSQKTATKKVIPKLQMIIHGISGEEGNRSAIVTFDREQLLLYEGDQDKNKSLR